MSSYQETNSASNERTLTAAHYHTLLDINNALITNLSQDELLRATCAALRRVVSFDLAGVNLYEPENGGLRLVALESDHRSEHFSVGQVLLRHDSCAGEAFDTQRAVVRRDMAVEARYTSEKRGAEEGFRSLCTLPLIVKGASLGSLTLLSRHANQYSEADTIFLQDVANQIALAIANMQAYEQVKAFSQREAQAAERRRTLLEINNAIINNLTQDDLFRAVCAALQNVLPVSQAGLSLYEAATNSLRLFALQGDSSGVALEVGDVLNLDDQELQQAFDFRQAHRKDDLAEAREHAIDKRIYEAGIRSYIIAPLVVQGHAIGTLGVGNVNPHQYIEADAEFLQETANQVALAVANMQAYEEIANLKAQLQAENLYLQEEIRAEHNFDEIVGNSEALLTLLHDVERLAPTDSTVLLFGETGTGKELIARAIHDRSARKGRPLVKINCGAISAGLVESELFGHVKGAFTGAIDRRTGRFELADNGTLFLDEVGELPLDTQVKLLRVLQEGEFEPVGSSKTVRVNVRVIAATNRDLEEEVRAGRFRADLYYRLNVLPLRMPSLSERRADIPQLVTFFAARFAKRFNKPIHKVSPETMERLQAYHWPGNIRELQNVIERAVVLSQNSVLTIERHLLPAQANNIIALPQLPAASAASEPSRANAQASEATNAHGAAYESPVSPISSVRQATMAGSLTEVERAHIIGVLEQSGWVIEGERGAAKILNLHPNTLRSRMKRLGIRRPQ